MTPYDRLSKRQVRLLTHCTLTANSIFAVYASTNAIHRNIYNKKIIFVVNVREIIYYIRPRGIRGARLDRALASASLAYGSQ